MDSPRKDPNDVSITGFALMYVVCLIVGGFSVLNAFLHANSIPLMLGCFVIAAAAVAGVVFCSRKLVRSLNV